MFEIELFMSIDMMVRVFANGPGDLGLNPGLLGHCRSYQRLKKWYLMCPCLTLSIIRYGSRLKWSNPGKGVAPSLTCSYRKGSLWVTLDFDRQLYFLLICLKMDLALNNQQWLICHKTKPNREENSKWK